MVGIILVVLTCQMQLIREAKRILHEVGRIYGNRCSTASRTAALRHMYYILYPDISGNDITFLLSFFSYKCFVTIE